MVRRVICLSGMLLLIALSGIAQFGVRPLSGVVTDARGNVLPGVAVQIENEHTLIVMSRMTGKDGRYYVNQLSDDSDYVVRAKYKRFWSRPRTLSKFDSSKHPEVDLVIPIE